MTANYKSFFSEPITSHSRLESYQKCPAFYHHKYLLKTPHSVPFNKYFYLGTIVHELIEDKLLNKSSTANVFNTNLSSYLTQINVSLEDIDDLNLLIQKLAFILYRCSSFCKAEDIPIRTNKGEVLKDPIKHPSSSLKQELNAARLFSAIGYFNNSISAQNEELIQEDIVWLLADALFLATVFQPPSWVTNTVAVELPISTNDDNKVKLPNTSVYINGYIDWIAETNGDIVIIDHKTSAKKPTGMEVLFHPQLNTYAFAYQTIYGILPRYIGINHLRSGNIILAEVDKEVMQAQVNHTIELQQSIESSQIFYKKSPWQFQSPCYKTDYISGRVVELCPFIESCWPTYNGVLKQIEESKT